MNRLQKAAVLTELADQLHRQGSWCGETHLQKATYILQDLLCVPLEFCFMLYKHGPFSFDLRDELTALRADGLLEIRPQPYPYGPSLLPTVSSAQLRGRYLVTLGRYRQAVGFVARTFGGRGVSELERLATAWYVTREVQGAATVEDRARRLHELKPHVAFIEAKEAVAEVGRIEGDARRFLGQ
jgi:hypothetical protein